MNADTQPAGEALSPAEQDYFTSRGEKTEGLAQAAQADAATRLPPDKAAQQPGDAAQAPDATQARDPKTGQFVPHGALHAERERRKSVERALQAERDERAKVNERVAALTAALGGNTAGAGQGAPPDPEQDIFGYMRHLEQQVAGLAGQVGETSKTVQEGRAEATFKEAYAADARAFIGATPDFADAYKHLMSARREMLAEAGYQGEDLAQALLAEERSLVQRALDNQASPSALLYAYARRLGFQPRASGDGAERVEAINRGQAAAKSLSSAGGASANALTPEALANMPQEEFNALYERLKSSGSAKVRAAFGG